MALLLSNGSDCAPTSCCMEYCLASILLLSLWIEELDLDQFETWTSQHIIHIFDLLSSIAMTNKESIAKDNLQHI
jgi:hypothetical protein